MLYHFILNLLRAVKLFYDCATLWKVGFTLNFFEYICLGYCVVLLQGW